jgi:excinuclease ABC subunit A
MREIFAQVPEARSRGYDAGRFSFNVKGGRCEACQGDGVIKVEMHFLPDVYVPCDVCKGQRYNRETLEIRYRGKNIHEVLDMTVEDGLRFFQALPAVAAEAADPARCRPRLSQARPERDHALGRRGAARQARQGARQARDRQYALHPRRADHRPALPRRRTAARVLHRLRDEGNTIVVIEHNLDVIKTADWIIDLGPKAAKAAGRGNRRIRVSGAVAGEALRPHSGPPVA